MIEWIDTLRLLAAALAGGIIGFERELHDKPAGLRTHMMICVGAALFTIVSERMSGSAGDPTRIAAQVVSGVGFLGAGVILHARGAVIGLTTAATIWVVASIGVAFGAGQFILGTLVTLAVAAILSVLGAALDRISFRRTTARFRVLLSDDGVQEKELRDRVESAGMTCEAWLISKTEAGIEIRAAVEGPTYQIERLQDELLKDERIRTFERK